MSYGDIERLREAGYKVIERNPWHYQIKGKTCLVNIWPSKRKYMREYGSGASFYTDPIEAVASIIGDPVNLKPKKTMFDVMVEEHERSITPQMRTYNKVWQGWRKAFANSIV